MSSQDNPVALHNGALITDLLAVPQHSELIGQALVLEKAST